MNQLKAYSIEGRKSCLYNLDYSRENVSPREIKDAGVFMNNFEKKGPAQ
jgi:hypothetical protein